MSAIPQHDMAESAAPDVSHLQRLGISAAEELRKTVRTALTTLFGNFLRQLPEALTVTAQNLSESEDRDAFLTLARTVPASAQHWLNTFIQQVDAHLIGDVSAGDIAGAVRASPEESFVLANLELRAEELHQKMVVQLDARLERVRQTIYIPIYAKALAPAGLCRALQDTADALNWPAAQRRILFEKFDDLVVSELQHLYQSLLDALARIGTIATRVVTVAAAAAAAAPAVTPAVDEKATTPKPAPAPQQRPAAAAPAPVAAPLPQPAAPAAPTSRVFATPTPTPSAPTLQPLPAFRVPYDANRVDSQTLSMLKSFAANDAGTVYSDGALASELLALSENIPIPDLPQTQHWVPMQRMTLAGHFLSEAIADPLIPQELKQQHESVRFPLVKSALADETFFTAVTHPLRSLVNELMLKSATSRVTGSAETRRIAELLQQVLVQFDLAPSFVREAMLTSKPLGDKQMKQFADMQRQQAQQRRESVLNEVKRKVIHELEQCTFSLSLPAQAVTFLNKIWGPLLMKRLLQHGSEHAAWKESLSLMEQLLSQLEARQPGQPPSAEWRQLTQAMAGALATEGFAGDRIQEGLTVLEAARQTNPFEF